MQFSDNVAFLEPSATLALAARARKLAAEGRSIVDLSTGEPAYPTPEYASRAGIQAIREGKTGYPPTLGVPELREAFAAYLSEVTAHGEPSPSQVLVSAGVKQALFNTAYCLFGEGDEVLVPAPYWPTYPALVRLAGAVPVVVETRWEEGFRLHPDLLEEARSPRTRGLLLNSPSNPTGAVYDAGTTARIAEWCDRHGVWILADEIYRPLTWSGGGRSPSLFDLDALPDRSVVLTGVSKALCMPGWRIGCAVGPEELVRKASDLQSQTTSGAAMPSQHAAAAALGRSEEREAAIASLRRNLRKARDRGVEVLEETEGLEVFPPGGAIYLYARLTGETDCTAAAEGLLQEAGVAAVPGQAFGSPGHLRFNFAVRPDTLEEGLSRVRVHFDA